MSPITAGRSSVWQIRDDRDLGHLHRAAGDTYGFYSVATDNVGNVEATPTAPQATTLVQIPTTTSLIDEGPNPSNVGDAVNFVVTVGPTVPDGETVILEDASNGNAVVGTGTLTGGTMTISVANLTAGTHNIFAIYGGDATYALSQSDQVAQVVNTLGRPRPSLRPPSTGPTSPLRDSPSPSPVNSGPWWTTSSSTSTRR